MRRTARAMTHAASRVLVRMLVLLLRAYQAVHVAFFRGSCRFHPTCSQYAIEALELHGPVRGAGLAAWRVLRCQPFCRGGFDPVPEPGARRTDCSHSHLDPTRDRSAGAPPMPRAHGPDVLGA